MMDVHFHSQIDEQFLDWSLKKALVYQFKQRLKSKFDLSLRNEFLASAISMTWYETFS